MSNERYGFVLNKNGFKAYQFTQSFSNNLKSSLFGIHEEVREHLKSSVYDYIGSSKPAGRVYESVSRSAGTSFRKMAASQKLKYPNRQETPLRTMTSSFMKNGSKATRKVTQYSREDVFTNHQASAPGQPPAIMSGDLIKSIYTKRGTAENFSIGSTSSYGSIFEGHPSQHNLNNEGVSVAGAFGQFGAGAYVSAMFQHNFGAKAGSQDLIAKHKGKLMSLYGTRPFIAPVLKQQRGYMIDMYTKAIDKFISRYPFRYI